MSQWLRLFSLIISPKRTKYLSRAICICETWERRGTGTAEARPGCSGTTRPKPAPAPSADEGPAEGRPLPSGHGTPDLLPSGCFCRSETSLWIRGQQPDPLTPTAISGMWGAVGGKGSPMLWEGARMRECEISAEHVSRRLWQSQTVFVKHLPCGRHRARGLEGDAFCLRETSNPVIVQ